MVLIGRPQTSPLGSKSDARENQKAEWFGRAASCAPPKTTCGCGVRNLVAIQYGVVRASDVASSVTKPTAMRSRRSHVSFSFTRKPDIR